MRKQPEQFMVVAFAEHHKRHAVPALQLPQHILLASFNGTYRHQAMTRISDAVRGTGEHEAEVSDSVQVGGNTAWTLKSESLVKLRAQIINAALRCDTELTGGSEKLGDMYMTMRDGELYVPGDVLPNITELSVVGWIGAGLVVYKNIPLGSTYEAAT